LTVLAYSEDPGLASEVYAGATEIAKQLGSEALSIYLDANTAPNSTAGKAVVLKSDRQLSGHPDLSLEAISEYALQRKPSAVLIGGTRFGRQLASQLAVRMRVGVLSDVRCLKVENGKLRGVRQVYAGKYSAEVVAPLPCVAVIPAGAYEKNVGTPSVETVTVGRASEKISHVETKPKGKVTVDIKNASIIVSAGRGFRNKEDLVLLDELAKKLNGAVGCSRPLSSDLGWLGEEHHIGLTGARVHPDLYLAVGISGQLQHVAGIKDSKIIVAVNKDKQAPIFQVADYGIVGDLYQVIPALLKHLG